MIFQEFALIFLRSSIFLSFLCVSYFHRHCTCVSFCKSPVCDVGPGRPSPCEQGSHLVPQALPRIDLPVAIVKNEKLQIQSKNLTHPSGLAGRSVGMSSPPADRGHCKQVSSSSVFCHQHNHLLVCHDVTMSHSPSHLMLFHAIYLASCRHGRPERRLLGV